MVDLRLDEQLSLDSELQGIRVVLLLEEEIGQRVHELDPSLPKQHLVQHLVVVSHFKEGQICSKLYSGVITGGSVLLTPFTREREATVHSPCCMHIKLSEVVSLTVFLAAISA